METMAITPPVTFRSVVKIPVHHISVSTPSRDPLCATALPTECDLELTTRTDPCVPDLKDRDGALDVSSSPAWVDLACLGGNLRSTRSTGVMTLSDM